MKPITIAMLVSWMITIIFLVVAAVSFRVDSGKTGMNFGYALALMAALITGLIALTASIVSVVSWMVMKKKRDS